MARRRTTKKRTRSTKKISKAFKKYVKSQITKNIETKQYMYKDSFRIADNTVRSYNLGYILGSQGTSDSQFIGNVLKYKSLVVRLMLTNTGLDLSGSTASDTPVYWKVALVRSKIYKTTTNLTKEELYIGNSIGTNFVETDFDKEKVSVVRQKHFKLAQPPSYDSNTRFVTMNIRLNDMWKYRDFTNNYEGARYNYYLIVHPVQSQFNRSITMISFDTGIQLRILYQDA